jgi:hypothetical protein
MLRGWHTGRDTIEIEMLLDMTSGRRDYRDVSKGRGSQASSQASQARPGKGREGEWERARRLG